MTSRAFTLKIISTIVLFALAFTISEFLAYLERRVSYYAAKR